MVCGNMCNVEAVVEGMSVSVGPRRDNNLAPMHALSTSSLDIIESMFVVSANEDKTGQSRQNVCRTLYLRTV